MKNVKIFNRHALIMLALLALSLCGASFSASFAQGTAFTYQGRLTTGTNPVSGNYDLTFSLYGASSGGTLLAGPVTNTAVAVSNGLFTVQVDFGTGAFTGSSNWLAISVRTNGPGTFSPLTPLQQMTPTPYAIFAEGANAAGLSGTIPTGDFSGTYGSAVTLDNAGNSFAGDGTGLVNVNANLLDGLASSNFWQTTGNAGTTAGVNFVGTTDNQPLQLRSDNETGLQIQYWSTSVLFTSFDYGINIAGGYWGNTISNGVVGATIAGGGYLYRANLQFPPVSISVPNVVEGSYGSVGGGYGNTAGFGAVVPGGYDNIASGNGSFAAGRDAQTVYDGSFVWSDGSATFNGEGTNSFAVLASGGVFINNGPQGVNLDQAGLNNGTINYGLRFGLGSGEGIGSKRTAGGNAFGLDLYTDFGDRISIQQHGNVGIGTTNPASLLEVEGDVRLDSNRLLLLTGTDTNNGLAYTPNVLGLPAGIFTGSGPFLFGFDGGALGAVLPNTVCLSWDYSGDVWVSNNLSTASLTIRGGADLAEPFNITTDNGGVPQGAVVVIDDQNPGHLRLSDRPYDTRVAGVVSGANGVNPGIQMHQQGLIEGGKNVALTGRVYVQADDSNGAIRPGDLLTTSGLPGRAMKVSDHARAAGAILGKAMTGLSQGQGMVLVLVTLQ